jgi:hypothetical protein
MYRYVGLLLLGLASTAAAISYLPIPRSDLSYERPSATVVQGTTQATASREVDAVVPPPDTRPVVKHVPLPPQVKAIYMTSCVAGTPSFRDRLLALIAETEINSVIIDIKDYSGTISFPPMSDAWQPAWENARCGARDMRELIATLHEAEVFVIGRITVFQDPFAAKQSPHLAVKSASGERVWTDHKGLSFIDVAAKEYWDHIILLARDSYNLGFDELNFDYVRYPSDGNMQDISFPHTAGSAWPHDKQANLEEFFRYLNLQLDDEKLFAEYRHEDTGRASSTPWTSADLFGMTTTNYDDLSIGQVQDRAVPYFDFIAPMVYPSHYPKNYLNLGDPNDHPYEIVYHAMKTGVDRLRSSTTPMAGFTHTRIGTSTPALYEKPIYTGDKLRTWIQDFDYGGDYDAADVRAQIQASYDAGVMSWMIWAAALKEPGVLEVATSTER